MGSCLGVTNWENFEQAIALAHAAIDKIQFQGCIIAAISASSNHLIVLPGILLRTAKTFKMLVFKNNSSSDRPLVVRVHPPDQLMARRW